jgi:pyridoxal phosphate enzyme (YggS family)
VVAFPYLMSIAENIVRVRELMSLAASRAGRDADAITLMAVSKTFPPEAIRQVYAAGIRVFGENRVQEFAGKAEALRDLSDARWHLIGHLQSNKAAKAAELFHAIDSVDSLKLAEKLNDAAGLDGEKLSVLVEINVGGEVAKSGVAPHSAELDEILTAAHRLTHLQFRGLMTIPPYTEDPQGARAYFRKLRELRERLAERHFSAVSLDQISMGMSHDFEVAIEEGSTCIRVGTAIFGERKKP